MTQCALAFLILASAATSAFSQSDVAKALTANPDQVTTLFGKRAGGVWEFALPKKKFNLTSLVRNSVPQLERAIGKGAFVEATHVIKSGDSAGMKIVVRFHRGVNQVTLRAEREGANWRDTLESFGIETREIASESTGDSPQFRSYNLKIGGVWAAAHTVTAFEMSAPEMKVDGSSHFATVTFTPKSVPKVAVSSSVLFVYEQGRLVYAMATIPGKHPPKVLTERIGVTGKLVPMEQIEPGRDAWRIESAALTKQGLSAEVVSEKTHTWLIVLPAPEEPTGRGEAALGVVALDLPKLLGKSLAEWEKVLGETPL